MYNSAAFSRQRNILINAVSQIMIAYFDRKELCFGSKFSVSNFRWFYLKRFSEFTQRVILKSDLNWIERDKILAKMVMGVNVILMYTCNKNNKIYLSVNSMNCNFLVSMFFDFIFFMIRQKDLNSNNVLV